MNANETLPDESIDSRPISELAPEIHALVLLWSREEPWRVGQVLLVPSGEPGPAVIFGRGATGSDCPSKVLLGEQRPGRWNAAPPLNTASVSRAQLEICALDHDRILVKNVGRCPLFRDDTVVSDAELRVGDTFQVGKQLLFLVVRRPAMMGRVAHAYPDFPFGVADAHGIVGESAAIWQLRSQIAFIAARGGHVLVSGATGTGKELVAQAIHGLSARKGQRLVTRNAATIPETLVDAELFGNAKNYPNPGMAERPGLVGLAHRSTLMLDEIAELPRASQAHLLRVLDQGEYHRLGDGQPRVSDFTLIGATNREPSALKHDLLARLTFRVSVPDLNERREDIALLARHLVRRAAQQGDEVAKAVFPQGNSRAEPALRSRLVRDLVTRHYETNVRELQAEIWHALATPGARADVARRAASPATIPPPNGAPHSSERERIQRCLDEHNGVLELAWRALGMKNRFVLSRAIKKYGLEVRKRHPSSMPPK